MGWELNFKHQIELVIVKLHNTASRVNQKKSKSYKKL